MFSLSLYICLFLWRVVGTCTLPIDFGVVIKHSVSRRVPTSGCHFDGVELSWFYATHWMAGEHFTKKSTQARGGGGVWSGQTPPPSGFLLCIHCALRCTARHTSPTIRLHIVSVLSQPSPRPKRKKRFWQSNWRRRPPSIKMAIDRPRGPLVEIEKSQSTPPVLVTNIADCKANRIWLD